MKHLRNLSVLPVLAVLIATLFSGSCSDDDAGEPEARASKVNSRTELIGGPTALGEVGDYMLENDHVRLLVQDKGYNRGSGVFGGSLIDADLVRPGNEGNVFGGNGRDTFGELFPAFFLEMIDPEQIEVINDGSDGKAAIVEVRGRGGEFITMLRYLNQLMIRSYSAEISDLLAGKPASSDGEPLMEFSTRYILEPGARHVRIESTMRNISFKKLQFPDPAVLGLLESFLGLTLSDFRLPMGHVLGFGYLSDIFLPGVGYNLRYGLEEAYETPVELPAFPGLLVDMVGSSSTEGVNYGFATEANPDANFAFQKDKEDLYPTQEAQPNDLLFLFYASGFGGVFSHQGPKELSPSYCEEGRTAGDICDELFPDCSDETCSKRHSTCVDNYDTCLTARQETPSEFTFTNYFLIGDGDVASLRDELYEIRETDTERVRGRVLDTLSGQPVGEYVSVLFYEANSADCSEVSIDNQAFTNTAGYVELRLPAGDYCYRTAASKRDLGPLKPLKVKKGSGASFEAMLATSGAIEGHVVDQDGTPLPAKMTVVGIHEHREGEIHRDFLYDLVAGESWRASDMEPDDADDPSTRQFMEGIALSGADGRVRRVVPPGDYTVYFSRGPEYDLYSREVSVGAGETVRVNGQLNRVVDTTGYISGDFHMHAAGSIDSGLDYNVRIRSIAAEGLETVAATDHNYVSNYDPYILRNDLQPWLNGIVGIELTTFESGHFNAFPVEYDVDSPNRGSIPWQEIPPDNLFKALRDMAPTESGNIIQVNHPRTPILGYFYQHNVDPFDTSVQLAFKDPDLSGVDELTAVVTSPTGPQFIETSTMNGDTTYETTFSWDFDAIEIFNGPHFEELRHFRMPYDKSAAAGADDALPPDVLQGFRNVYTEGMEEADINDALATFLDKEVEEVEQMSAADREAAIEEWVRSQIPEKNTVLCDGNEIIFAGGLDDWYNLLNYRRPDGTYRKYTATGNSDSHHAVLDEPAYPRNYYYVGHDDPQNVTDADVVHALRERHNIITNGPFINMTVDGNPVGSDIAAPNGEVEITVTIRAADWVGADRFRILGNGEVVRGLTDDQEDGYWGWVPVELQDGEFEQTFDVSVDRDTWFVLEVEGDNNLFPVVHPQEEEQFNFDAVIGNLAGAFGFGGGVPGLEPDYTFPIRPFAFTNPVWVEVDGNGEFDPLEPPAYECSDGQYQQVNGLMSAEKLREWSRRRLKAASVPKTHEEQPFLKRPAGVKRDVRIIFETFGAHHH